MKCLLKKEEKDVFQYFEAAINEAKKASCLRAKCGSVVVKSGSIIGKGFNSPPKNLESQRRCKRKSGLKKGFKSDRTCCIHAEARAIADAIKNNPKELVDSQLYFVRIDDSGTMKKSGDPYCTYCSKLSLDSGIKEFVLWQEKGICIYDTEEYNNISYEYGDDTK